MVQQPRVVVIEDAPEIRMLLTDVLGREGFAVHAAEDGEQGLRLVEQERPDVVILDLVLPGMDGLEVCRLLREQSDAYVIMLTSKDDEVDKIVGLSVGADDYVTKPFSSKVLVARVKAMLRRPRAPEAVEDADQVRRLGELQVDLEAREVVLEDEPVELTRIEFDLLAALTLNPRRVLTRGQLLEQVWGDAWIGEDHLVEVHVSKLRAKLGDSARSPRFIQTVRGVGYRMVTDAG